MESFFGNTRLDKKRRPAAALSAVVRFEGDRASLTSFTGNTTGHCGCMEVRHKPWESIEPPQVMEPETRKAISPLTYYYYPLTHYPSHSLSISCSSNVSSVRESLHPSRTPPKPILLFSPVTTSHITTIRSIFLYTTHVTLNFIVYLRCISLDTGCNIKLYTSVGTYYGCQSFFVRI